MSHEPPGISLQPTALVNELYLQLVDLRAVEFQNRSQFYGMASQMMRRRNFRSEPRYCFADDGQPLGDGIA